MEEKSRGRSRCADAMLAAHHSRWDTALLLFDHPDDLLF